MIITQTHCIHTDDLWRVADSLCAGDRVLLSGTVYTSRDAAHKRIVHALECGDALPFPLEQACIYYSGATPAPEGQPIGSCGPTTSGRMDPFAPALYDRGVCATIGKGERSEEVVEAIVRNHGVYLCAVGGAGALAAECVTSCEVIAYDDLGCEAVKRLTIDAFPLIVAIDCHGGNLFA